MSGTLRADDVIAARILTRQQPGLRARCLLHLDAMTKGEARRSLLGTLVADRLLPMEEARGVQDKVDRYRRGRGLGIFDELLQRAGVGAEVVREAGRRIGPQVDLEALGAALVAAGVIDAATEGQVRYQARVTNDRDLAQEVTRYVDGRRASAGQPSLDGLAPAGSIMFKLDLPVPSPQEAKAIVARTMTETISTMRGPRFRIPPWVDIGDRMIGKVIADEYIVCGKIGAGGNGAVYLAYAQEAPDRPLALKLLDRHARPSAVGRFEREALANSLFAHRNALEIAGAGKAKDGARWLAMEFFDGHDLAHLLERRGKLPPPVALRIVRQVLEALGAAHEQGVIHRDIKPENILVSDDLQRVKLMDFGIALLRNLGEFDGKVFHTIGPDVVGTPRYMSPEQASSETLGPATDLYSIGLVLYEALSGCFPYESEGSLGYLACHIAEDPKPLRVTFPGSQAWPASLHRLLDSLLQKDPDERPQAASDVARAIDGILQELPPA